MKRSKFFLATTAGVLAIAGVFAAKVKHTPLSKGASVKTSTAGVICVHFGNIDGATITTAKSGSALLRTSGGKTLFISVGSGASACSVPLYTKRNGE